MTAVPVPFVIALFVAALVLGPALVLASDHLRLAPAPAQRRRLPMLLPGGVLSVLILVAAFAASNALDFAVVVVGGALLIVVSLVDIAERRIPNRVTYPAMMGCLAVAVVAVLISPDPDAAWSALIGGATFAVVLLALHVARPDAMGRGDVKLAFPLGCAIGWATTDPAQVVVAVGWTLALASVLGLAVAATRGRGLSDSTFRRRSIAFGPALSTASAATVLVALASS